MIQINTRPFCFGSAGIAYDSSMAKGSIIVNDKVVWLTGCASGVGLHLTDAFLARGARVFATDIDLDGMRHAARANGWDAGRLLMRRLDVSDRSAWDALYTELIGAWGRFDMLFNVAGVIRPGRLVEATEQDVEFHFRANLSGVIVVRIANNGLIPHSRPVGRIGQVIVVVRCVNHHALEEAAHVGAGTDGALGAFSRGAYRR